MTTWGGWVLPTTPSVAEILLAQKEPIMVFASVLVAVYDIEMHGGTVVGYHIGGRDFWVVD